MTIIICIGLFFKFPEKKEDNIITHNNMKEILISQKTTSQFPGDNKTSDQIFIISSFIKNWNPL